MGLRKMPKRAVSRATARRLAEEGKGRFAALVETKAFKSSERDWGRSQLNPDKGQKDGSCNRTACQAPLAGRPQYYMRDYGTTDGRLYYCEPCAIDFTHWDRIDRPGQPFRCTFDETTGERSLIGEPVILDN